MASLEIVYSSIILTDTQKWSAMDLEEYWLGGATGLSCQKVLGKRLGCCY